MSSRAEHEQFLKLALRIARRGHGLVEPNPMVGCVLVREGRVIGRGWHRRYGGPHAEVEAVRSAIESTRGATAYVTLEPCCHQGKTGPCTEALLAAGIARVVSTIEDPNPIVAGGGFRRLRDAGVEVITGLLADEAERLAASFLKRVRTGLPWVIAKWAQSLDGKLATYTGDSRWITDEAMRAHVHRMRGRVDALIVGVGTAVSDRPQLTARSRRPRRIPRRVVIDSDLRTPLDSPLVATARLTPTWLFCAPTADPRRRVALEHAGCRVEMVDAIPEIGEPGNGPARLDLRAVLRSLAADGCANVIIEGGGTLLGGFLSAGLVDEVHAYIAPLLIGDDRAAGVWRLHGAARISAALRLRRATFRKLGGGWLGNGFVMAPSESPAPMSARS